MIILCKFSLGTQLNIKDEKEEHSCLQGATPLIGRHKRVKMVKELWTLSAVSSINNRRSGEIFLGNKKEECQKGLHAWVSHWEMSWRKVGIYYTDS